MKSARIPLILLADSHLPAKPDLLYLAVPGEAGASLAKRARGKGFRGLDLGAVELGLPQFLEPGGTAAEGSYFTDHFSGDTRLEVRILRQYHANSASIWAAPRGHGR